MIKAIVNGESFQNVTKLTASDGVTDAVVNLEEVGTIPIPTESINISNNGSFDVTSFANAVVNVGGGAGPTVLFDGTFEVTETVGTSAKTLHTFTTGLDYTSGEDPYRYHLLVVLITLEELTEEQDALYYKGVVTLPWWYNNRVDYRQNQGAFSARSDGYLKTGVDGLYVGTLYKHLKTITVTGKDLSSCVVAKGTYRLRLIDTGAVLYNA